MKVKWMNGDWCQLIYKNLIPGEKFDERLKLCYVFLCSKINTYWFYLPIVREIA